MKKSLRIPAGLLASAFVVGSLGFAAPATAVPEAPKLTITVPEESAVNQCSNPLAPITVEEQRLSVVLQGQSRPTASILIEAGGFNANVDKLVGELCSTATLAAAKTLVAAAGNQLWRDAVDRAQGRLQQGSAEQIDDRPLYWARLAMTKAVRQWLPLFVLEPAQRDQLIKDLDYASRGVTSIGFPAGAEDQRRVLLTGFDPFFLDGTGAKRINPSGIAALQLDGKEIETENGPAVVQAAMLPVDWRAFDGGIVEQIYGTALSASAEQRPGTIITISQGAGAGYNIEKWAASNRGGTQDNNNYSARGDAPQASGWPQVDNQFIETTLPAQQMIDAGTGTRSVQLNPKFCESANASRTPSSCKTSGAPAPGSYSVSGGGGDYLSNESMYRANRVRLGLGLTTLAGGHLHTPYYDIPPVINGSGNTAFFDTLRRDTQQVVNLVAAAAAAQP